MPVLLEHQTLQEETFQDGPRHRLAAGAHREDGRRRFGVCRMGASPYSRASTSCLFLEAFLQNKADLTAPPTPEPTDETRERSLLGLRVPGRGTRAGSAARQTAHVRKRSRPRYHEANLLTANHHVVEALDVLELASRGDFAEPYYLPGYLLARLGQLYDLTDNRGRGAAQLPRRPWLSSTPRKKRARQP